MIYEYFLRSTFSYSVLAVVVFLAMVVTLHLKKNRSGEAFKFYIFSVLGFLVGVLYICLRPDNAGNDTAEYLSVFKSISNISNAWSQGSILFGNREVLFWPSVAVMKYLFLSEDNFVFYSGLICLLLTYIFCIVHAKADSYPLSYSAVAFCFLMFSYELVYFGNLMRAGWAFPVCAASLALTAHRPILSLLLLLFSIGLHFSCIIGLPLYIILASGLAGSINRFWMLLAIGASFVLSKIVGLIFDLFTAGLAGGALADKAFLYSNREFNITNIFVSFNFVFLFLHVLLMVGSGVRRAYIPFIYFFCMVIVLSPMAKVADRIIPLALLFAPFVMLDVLKRLFGERASLFLATLFYLPSGVAILQTYSAMFTLGISS